MRISRVGWSRWAAFLLAVGAAILAIVSAPDANAEAPRKAQIDAPNRVVTYGAQVTLAGNFPGASNARVAIHYRALGDQHPHRVKRVRTGPKGHWKARVQIRRSGFWRAALVNPRRSVAPAPGGDAETNAPDTGATVDSRSDAERVIVRSITKASVSRRHVIVGKTVRVRGRVLPGGGRRQVTVISSAGQRQKAWTARSGRFSVRWPVAKTGGFRLRVRAEATTASKPSGNGAGRVTVYRGAGASWYGPGFYGNHTSCGQILTPSTIGVAHKYLPCGTRLRLRYGSRTIRVRVIDTGPFVPGREFDLTQAVKNRLGFPDVGTVLTSR